MHLPPSSHFFPSLPLQPTVHRLPDELIIDIFRNEALSRPDLYRCALVSRRFLGPVNEILYSDLDIMIVRLWDSSIDPDEDSLAVERRWAWAPRSALLESTLSTRPDLARHVRSIEFRHQTEDIAPEQWPQGGWAWDELQTIPSTAFETVVLVVSRSIEKIAFEGDWVPTSVELDLLAQLPQIKCLTFNSDSALQTEEYDFLVENLPNLKELHTHSLDLGVDEGDYFKKLEVIDVRFHRDPDVSLERRLRFVLSNKSTLRSLRLNLDVALYLDYSQFPHLVELDLTPPMDWSENPRLIGAKQDELESICPKFWNTLSKSLSLRTLSISSSWGYEMGELYARALYRCRAFKESSIPTLKTLRFKDDIDLNFANGILSSRFVETVDKIVLLYYSGWEGETPERMNKTPERMNKLKFVTMVSRGKEVVVRQRTPEKLRFRKG